MPDTSDPADHPVLSEAEAAERLESRREYDRRILDERMEADGRDERDGCSAEDRDGIPF